MSEESETIIEKKGRAGRITLNRPKALNALTRQMCLDMTKALLEWRNDPDVKVVVVDGAGDRGFCAGGDIRLLYESGKAGDERAYEFWRDEYRLNQLIKRYSKPYVAMIDGIVMGGGVGVSVHGDYRVAGDSTMLAMPETGIGFYPDVGGTYFLPRLPGKTGMWMGLTGARLKTADAMAMGIATSYTPSDKRPALIEALENGPEGIEDTLAAFAEEAGESEVKKRQEDIETHFAAPMVEAILASLDNDRSDWAIEQAKTMRTKSPTSLKLTHRAIQMGAQTEFEDTMRRELRLSAHCLKGHDFYEGVRAQIIDKDRDPKWDPSDLERVGDAELEQYFAPLDNDRELTFIDDTKDN
ncbi:enoyl-CoA hydratase/isomerase family protein [Euryhalocaulis caribicus]|uniref:enoyl-CoA hydratase/isomerase family protein n=1 Tax=Euryhalocaulis caribicus TaxID=1161401 RepID=UPI00039B4B7E|nr:enoyl-CoA hydratase/isomerase family protein [Euryhalocaulis caribicus]